MKKVTKNFSLVLVTNIIVLMVSCSYNLDYTMTYRTVSFDSDGGSPVSNQIVVDGCTALKPVDPVFEGHEFIGWFDENSIEFDFASSVKSNVSLIAHWTGSNEKQTVASVQSVGFESGTSKEAVEFTVSTTPNGSKEKQTKIEIPAGAITTSSTGSDISSSVTISTYDVAVASETTSFTVGANNVAVAGIDCKLELVENGQLTEISDFNGQKVKVSTYILKGLDSVNVVYDDVESTGKAQPTDVEYDKTTGLLSFCTTHFSTFYIESTAKAYVVETNTAYEDLEDAVEAAPEGSTIKLLKDIDLGNYPADTAAVLDFNESVTLDLNNKTISSNNFGVVYQGEKLTIKNGKFIAAYSGSYSLFVGDTTYTTGVVLEDVECTGGINCFNTEVTIKNSATTQVIATNYYAVWADEDATITIEGGTYISTGTKPAVLAYEDTISIVGGTFTTDPTSYVASGYEAVADSPSQGRWTVSKITQEN